MKSEAPCVIMIKSFFYKMLKITYQSFRFGVDVEPLAVVVAEEKSTFSFMLSTVKVHDSTVDDFNSSLTSCRLFRLVSLSDLFKSIFLFLSLRLLIILFSGWPIFNVGSAVDFKCLAFLGI